MKKRILLGMFLGVVLFASSSLAQVQFDLEFSGNLNDVATITNLKCTSWSLMDGYIYTASCFKEWSDEEGYRVECWVGKIDGYTEEHDIKREIRCTLDKFSNNANNKHTYTIKKWKER